MAHNIHMLNHGTIGGLRVYGRVAAEFDIITGVKQGDVVIPTLFNFFFYATITASLAPHPH